MAAANPLVALLFSGLLATGCSGERATPERNVQLSNLPHTQNKVLVRRLFEEGMNRAQGAVFEQLVGPEYVDATGERGPNAFKQVMSRLHTAFPDLTYVIDDILGEGDEVAVRWHWTGTHRGAFRGVPPTERSVTNTGTAIFRVRDGKIIAAALETDRLGFLQSIGVVPPNELLFQPSAPLGVAESATRK
jgi:steroid delta-isomerase-like uncharacterized protein